MGWVLFSFHLQRPYAPVDVEEHIPCHKGAYTGRNGITRDRLERPAGTQGIKEGGG